jgi:hypothetical protein
MTDQVFKVFILITAGIGWSAMFAIGAHFIDKYW